ncbi:iron-containing alcohol dehydrogenase [Deinococcus caeni]|uniref:iron-containing alcohol dehydrogenase n=1 Tax=Deinococcus caeni TaxID=569127 RepID=UPI003621E497
MHARRSDHGLREPPVGAGRRPPSPLRPFLAVPTTAGSGSEATTVAILDLPELHIKTGISHRLLRPSQALVDPELSRSAPPAVIAAAGLDVVCHAAESFLSRPYTSRPRPATPDERPPTRAATRWRTSGRPRRCVTAGSSCAAPCRATPRRAGS